MPPSRATRALERELGTSVMGPLNAVTGLAWVDDLDEQPDLRWPANIGVFDRMSRTDAQVAATLRAIFLPIHGRVQWSLGDAGVDPRVVRACEVALGLHEDGAPRRRRRDQRVAIREHVREAVRKLVYGHQVFEQVYEVGAPGPELTELPGMPPVMAHLRKLALRPAKTLARFDVERDGGLRAVAQYVPAPAGIGVETVTLPIERLVVHVNDRDGADWRGQSILRASYKHWRIKDALLKLGAQAVERNGMGLAVVTFDEAEGGTQAGALALAKRVRGGAEAGVAIPRGYSLQLLGVSGQVRDELPLVKYHDQAVGRNALAMFLDLGHDDGARSLGETFLDFWTLAENALVDDLAETITEHVIRDFVALNFGEDEPYPTLQGSELTPDQAMSASDLATLIGAKVITVDDDLEDEVRRRGNLPARGEPRELPPADAPPVPVDDLDFSVEDIIGLQPDPADRAPQPVGAGWSTEELLERSERLQAFLAGRAAAKAVAAR